jgi:hypothetical protein
VAVLSVVKSAPNGYKSPLPTHLFETNLLREGAMILFLGLRVEEPEELYHRNPVSEGACGYGMQAEAPQ